MTLITFFFAWDLTQNHGWHHKSTSEGVVQSNLDNSAIILSIPHSIFGKTCEKPVEDAIQYEG